MLKFLIGLYFLRRLFRKKQPQNVIIVIENRGRKARRKRKRK